MNHNLWHACRIVPDASMICTCEIVNGGEMRKQLAANKYQSVIAPLSIHASIIFLFVSNESNSTAIHKPNERPI